MVTTVITARQRRARNQRIVLLTAAVLLVGGGLWYLLRGEERAPAAEKQPLGTIAVPVAARPLPKGRELEGPGLIRPMYLRPEQVPPAALLKTNQIVSRVTRESLKAGDYFSEENLTAAGAPPGFSGLVRPGSRIVVIETTRIAGVIGYMREGDLVDVMALSQSAGAGARPGGGPTIEAGGTQPGSGGQAAGSGAARGGGGSLPGLTATLIAQGARVVIVPKPGKNQFAALEMAPEDAHLLTMVMSTNQVLHFVYRPFNDDSRLDADSPALAETRPPRDSRTIEMIEGVNRSVLRTTLN
ncbi:MAG TPA: Flp pilus assembly protein CpaB [Burkholderiaceae bacterium]|nr:Flp pilus assembly protein CpaB [Burkholderiaceae bacterium]